MFCNDWRCSQHVIFLLHPRYGGFFLEKNYYIIFDWLLTKSDWRLIVIFSFYSSCPYFRNEVGGEIECSVALCRGGNNGAILRKENEVAPSTHTPSSARGFNLFSTPDTYWKNGYCPYEPNNGGGQFSLNVIERIDSGSHYYKKHFYGQGKYLLVLNSSSWMNYHRARLLRDSYLFG